LIAATETAKKLFGTEMSEDLEKDELKMIDTTSELRIRLVQVYLKKKLKYNIKRWIKN
jgi:hypothetical protein